MTTDNELTLPDRKDVEEEMVSLLRSVGERNHRKPNSLMNLLKGKSYPKPNKTSMASWPPFKGALSADNRNLGKFNSQNLH